MQANGIGVRVLGCIEAWLPRGGPQKKELTLSVIFMNHIDYTVTGII